MNNNCIREYRIINKLGQGGMGAVYLAEHVTLGTKCAIKVLNKELNHIDKSGRFLERFIQEAQVLADLKHQNIVSFNHFFSEDDDYYMVLEYVKGITLKEYLLKKGRLSESESLAIFRQLLDGLGYAHTRGVIHRDLKPSNIIIDDVSGQVKILDFGIARILGRDRLTESGMTLGTVTYMSPEQVQALPNIDQRTDIYNLGILLFEMLTGVLPYEITTSPDFAIESAIVHKEYPDVRSKNPNVSANTAQAIHEATKKNPAERPVTCYKLGEILNGNRYEAKPRLSADKVTEPVTERKPVQKAYPVVPELYEQDPRAGIDLDDLPIGYKILLFLCACSSLVLRVSFLEFSKIPLENLVNHENLLSSSLGWALYLVLSIWLAVNYYFVFLYLFKDERPARMTLVLDLSFSAVLLGLFISLFSLTFLSSLVLIGLTLCTLYLDILFYKQDYWNK